MSYLKMGLVAGLAIAGCVAAGESGEDATETKSTGVVRAYDVSLGNDKLATKLYEHGCDETKNCVLGASSIYTGLAMWDGIAKADDPESNSVPSWLGFVDGTPDAFAQKLPSLNVDEGFKSVVAAAWFSNRQANTTHKALLTKYQAEQHLASGAAAINEWVSRKTNNAIKQITRTAEAGQDVLATASYFEDAFLHPFDECLTQSRPFGDSTAEMMTRTNEDTTWFTYAPADGKQPETVALDYRGGAQLKIFLAPKGSTTPPSLKGANIGFPRGNRVKGTVTMPRFTVGSTNAPGSFNIYQAFEKSNINVHAVHTALIHVNEKHTTAASASAFATRGPPPEELNIVINRPFAFAITVADTTMFVGHVVRPEYDTTLDADQQSPTCSDTATPNGV